MKACSGGGGPGSDAAPSACSLAALWQAEGGRRWAGPVLAGRGQERILRFSPSRPGANLTS